MARLWYEIGICLKIALCFTVLAFILFIVGFSTDVWVYKHHPDGSQRIYGMWRFLFYTYDNYSGTLRDNQGNNPFYVTRTDWYRATQAMECLGLICMIVATFILFLYFFVAKCKRRNALLAIILFTFASVLFIVIGVAIFASKFDDLYGHDVGWSMGLAIAAAILAFIAGVMEVLEIK